MLTHEEMVARMLDNPDFKREFDVQAEEFELLDELLKARHHAGLTQAEVAKRMGAKSPAVARLDAGEEPSPTVETLRKYAEAVGCRLEIRLRPCVTRESNS